MDLSLATVEQIVEELSKRPLDFALVVTPQDERDHAIESEYQVHSSVAESPDENNLQEAAYCMMATVSLLGRLAENLDELENAKAHDLWRWQAVGETIIRDMFATAADWEQEDEELGPEE